jgi:hypothetical protein
MQARVDVPLLHRTSNWVAWSTKITAFLSLRPTPVHEFLTRRPTQGDADEEEKDRVCLNHIILYIDDDLTTDVHGCLPASEAFSTLKQTILHQLQVRGQICNQRISQLQQFSCSIDHHLKQAQELMVEAQDINEPTYMKNLCSRVILGLELTLLKALGDNLMNLVETGINSNSRQSEISTVFNTVVKRIRARAHMFFSTPDDAESDQAAMFAVTPGSSLTPNATPQPPAPLPTPHVPSPHATHHPPASTSTHGTQLQQQTSSLVQEIAITVARQAI